MQAVRDVAALRLDNALALFDEFVRSTVKHADAATLRGLERRFAEKLQIQPSYWSQIKSRSRQIGERLARQFEQNCDKPWGWMDADHATSAVAPQELSTDSPLPQDEDERFIVGLVLTYYRRHPQRARTRLLDLLGEVLAPGAGVTTASPASLPSAAPAAQAPAPRTRPPGAPPAYHPAPPPPASDEQLWAAVQQRVAPLKSRKR